MATRRSSGSFDMAAAESRRVQAQQAINDRTRKENDRLYQEANARSQTKDPKRLDAIKGDIKKHEGYIKNLSAAAAAAEAEAAKLAKMTPVQRQRYNVTQQATAQMTGGPRAGINSIAIKGKPAVPGMASATNNSSIAAAMENMKYGGYSQDKAGYNKALADLETKKKERDRLTLALDPKYLTPDVAPAADPEAIGRARRRGGARSAQERGGRQATILSQGG